MANYHNSKKLLYVRNGEQIMGLKSAQVKFAVLNHSIFVSCCDYSTLVIKCKSVITISDNYTTTLGYIELITSLNILQI